MDGAYENTPKLDRAEHGGRRPHETFTQAEPTTGMQAKAAPVVPHIRVQPVLQMKKFSEQEIIDRAQEKFGLVLSMETHGDLIQFLTQLDVDAPAWMRVLSGTAIGASAGFASTFGTAKATSRFTGIPALSHIGTHPISTLIGLAGGVAGGITGGVMGYNVKPEHEVDKYLSLAKAFPGKTLEDYQALTETFSDKMISDMDTQTIDTSNIEVKRSLSMHELLNRFPDLLPEIEATFSPLRPICGDKGLLKLLESSMTYVNRNILLDIEAPPAALTGIVRRRMAAVRTYIENTYRDMDEELRSQYYLQPTGSDPHKGGHQVLMLVDKNSGRIHSVYKPRSVQTDASIVGTDGMFSYINSTLPDDKKKLPTMEITPDGEHGIEEFVVKKEAMSEKEADVYYYQMGMLEVASEYMGMSDLHQDNIMPTASGPIIIDAEVGLLSRSTGIRDALGSPEPPIAGAKLSADFKIGKKIPSSLEHFRKERLREVPVRFKTKYEEGKAFMENHMANLAGTNEFSSGLRQKTAGIKTRFVPLNTSIFASIYRRYISDDKAGTAEYVGNNNSTALDIFMGEFDRNLPTCLPSGASHAPYHVAPGANAIRINRTLMRNLVAASFNRGDVPCFEIQLPEAGQPTALLFLDGTPIGQADVEFRYQNLLR